MGSNGGLIPSGNELGEQLENIPSLSANKKKVVLNKLDCAVPR